MLCAGKSGPDTWLLSRWPGSTLLFSSPLFRRPHRLQGVSGCTPQDLQDRNDELQAALEGLRARLPPSWHGRPHAQPEEQLLPGHRPAGRSPVLGGDRLCAPAVGEQSLVALGVYLPPLHELPPGPEGLCRRGRPAAQRVRLPRDHMPFRLAHVGEGPVTQGQGQYPEPQRR